MTRIRSLTPLLLAASLIAAACGGDSDATSESSGDASPTASTASASDAETSDATTTTTEAAEEPDADEPAETTTTEAEPTTRVVSTFYGEFEVPSDPQRVVVINPSIDLAAALDVGANVIGTLSLSGEKPSSSLITDEEWDQLEVLGASVDSSLENIIAADPDLVLVAPNSEEEFELYAEALTSVPSVATSVWQNDALFVAEVVNKRDEMQALIDEYQVEADELAQRIDDEFGDPTVAFLRIRPGQLRIHSNLHFAGNIFDDVGLTMQERWVQPVDDDPVENLQRRVELISPEQIGLLADADHIFVLVRGTALQTDAEVEAARDEVLESALWATLPAVQNGDVHFVGDYWGAGTLRAAYAAVADLEAIFFG